MKTTNLQIGSIPAILWGKESSRLLLAVHGNMSSKSDTPISILAEEAVPLGYRVLSFDLPQHGDRKNDPTPCKVQNCVNELETIMNQAKTGTSSISLFACSLGAYFSLLAYRDIPLRQCLFLSPVVNMERIFRNMMQWFDVSEDRLRAEKEIETPIGQTLDWDYYCYVKENPIIRWNSPTSILYGENDDLCELPFVSSFASKFHCSLDIVKNAEHYFHTPDQLAEYRSWLKKHLLKESY